MIHLIIGAKGSGKTKQISEKINQSANLSSGNVVYISKEVENTWSIPHTVRVIDMAEFGPIDTYGELYSFICGLLSGNYDITDVFLDRTFSICGNHTAELSIFLALLEELSGEHHVTFTVSLSAAREELPSEIYQMASDVQFCD